MTGWELADPSQALQDGHPELDDFLTRYPLAALNPERDMLAVLRYCQPGLNLPPEGANSELQLHLFFVAAWSRYPLPQTVVFSGLEVAGRGLRFRTTEGEVVTNTSQLNQLMGATTDQELREIFLTLQDVYPPPRRPITSKSLQSRLLGKMLPVDFPDWWQGRPLEIPYFDGISLPVIFMGLHPDEDPDFVEEADQALESFLGLSRPDPDTTALVMANCRDFLEDVGDEEALAELDQGLDVWGWVRPSQIYLTRRNRRDQAVHLQISAHCEWEEEHGLQLVFRQGKDLVRVSPEDGHLTDSDAYDFPDEEDRLLAPVLGKK